MASGMEGYAEVHGVDGAENTTGDIMSDLESFSPKMSNVTHGSPNITLIAFKVIGLTIIILIGVVGNLLVCISVCKFRNLRIVANYFIVSLAVADLAVSGVVMPFALYQEVNGWRWWLGAWLCDVWVSVDVLTATASIWNLCGISVDRFLAITRPIQYARRRTPCMAMTVIISMWSTAFLISIPALIYVGGYDAEGTAEECALNVSPIFQVISSALSFYIPCFILLIVYYKIFRSVMALSAKKPGMREKIQRDAPSKVVTMQTNLNVESKENLHDIKPQNALTVENNGRKMSKRPSEDASSHAGASPPSMPCKQQYRDKSSTKKISVARERRATSVLAIVVTIFICCWLPFFITNVVMGLCKDCNITFTIFNSVTWMGWCNSAANPIIYTIFNREFRNAFHRLLTCNTRQHYGMR